MGLDPGWDDIITDTVFPVIPGTVVTVTCSKPGHYIVGNTVTCVDGTQFIALPVPSCKGTSVLRKQSFMIYKLKEKNYFEVHTKVLRPR